MYLAAASIAIPSLTKHYQELTENKGLLLALGVAAGVTNIAFVVALIEGEVMRVMLLFYLSPIWTVLLGRWWLGEHLSSKAIMLFSVAMIGSLVMLWNPEMGLPWPHSSADALALIAGIAFSINNVLARKLSALTLSLKTGVTWWGVVCISLLVITVQQAPVPAVTTSVWIGAWLLGWLGIVAMTVTVLYGVALMPVYRSSVIMLFELIVAAVAAWLLTEETMTRLEWLGGGLILMAAYGVARIQVSDKQ